MNILDRIRDGRTLLGRGARGGAWLGAGSASEQGFRFLRNLILARLLAPEAFGVMAIVLTCCSLAQVLTGLGVKEAVIQSPHAAERTYLNGVWYLSMARSLLIYVVAFVAAPWIEAFYQEPGLSALLRLAFVAFLAQGAVSPRVYVALKQANYFKWALIQHGGGILGVLTTITLAFVVKGVWALVIGYVMESVARLVLSMCVCPFWPGLHFAREHLRGLWHYTRGMFGMPILASIYSNASIIVVGKLCPKQELGRYAMVVTLATMGSGMLADIIRSVLLPAFAEIQSDAQRLNRYLMRITSGIIGLGIPAAVFMGLYAANILALAYGDHYTAAAGPFAALFANDVLAVCNVPVVALYLAIGQPALLRRAAFIRALPVLLLIYPAVKYVGLLGAALTPAVALAVSFGFQVARVRSLTGLDVRKYLAIVPRAFLFSLPVLVAWVGARSLAKDGQSLTTTAFGAALSGAIYAVVALLAIRHRPLREFIWPRLSLETAQ